MSGFPPGIEHLGTDTAVGLLFVLEALFAGRVIGQWLVSRGAGPGLPPMSEWFSGLIPYPRLLALQVSILALMSAITFAVAIGFPVTGFVEAPRAFGTVVLLVAWPYGLSMPIRYAVRMWRHPEARWTGRTIPIVFHIVLAGWLFVLGSYLRPTS